MNTNRVSDEELHLFKKVVELLNKLGINYWLDQGSLLGAVRDGAFFPWDHDIDLGVFDDDINRCQESFIYELRRFGAYITVLPYVIKISYRGYTYKSVDLRIYHHKDGFAFTELRSTTDKNQILKRIISKYAGRFIKLGHLIYYYGNNKLVNPLSLTLINIFNVWNESLKDRRVIFRVNERYFQDLKATELHGLEVSIPRDAEGYLRFKYGEDWRTPCKNWIYWEQDGALFKTE